MPWLGLWITMSLKVSRSLVGRCCVVLYLNCHFVANNTLVASESDNASFSSFWFGWGINEVANLELWRPDVHKKPFLTQSHHVYSRLIIGRIRWTYSNTIFFLKNCIFYLRNCCIRLGAIKIYLKWICFPKSKTSKLAWPTI